MKKDRSMEKEFTYNQIVHLNSLLQELGLAYRAEFKDERTAGIQELGICACIGREGEMRQAVKGFFEKEGIPVAFSENGFEIFLMNDK